jgi:hypothetical protein
MIMRKGIDKPSEQEVEETFMIVLSASLLRCVITLLQDIIREEGELCVRGGNDDPLHNTDYLSILRENGFEMAPDP